MRTMSYQIENINKEQTKGGECHELRHAEASAQQ